MDYELITYDTAYLSNYFFYIVVYVNILFYFIFFTFTPPAGGLQRLRPSCKVIQRYVNILFYS